MTSVSERHSTIELYSIIFYKRSRVDSNHHTAEAVIQRLAISCLTN